MSRERFLQHEFSTKQDAFVKAGPTRLSKLKKIARQLNLDPASIFHKRTRAIIAAHEYDLALQKSGLRLTATERLIYQQGYEMALTEEETP